MFETAEIDRLSRRRNRILAVGMTVAVVVILTPVALVSIAPQSISDLAGQHLWSGGNELASVALLILSLAIFLATLVGAEKRSRRFALICPSCGDDLTRSTKQVLLTRRCRSCRVQIVEGRTYAAEVYQRHTRMRQRRFLIGWLWLWPIFGVIVLASHQLNPIALNDCHQCLWIPGLIGSVSAGWSFIRTLDRRTAPQAVLSTIVLLFALLQYFRN